MKALWALICLLSFGLASTAMAEEKEKQHINGEVIHKTYETSVGTFEVARCLGWYATSEAESRKVGGRDYGGRWTDRPICDMIQVPNGNWIKGEGGSTTDISGHLRTVVEFEGKVFLVTSRAVYQYLHASQELVRELSLFSVPDYGHLTLCKSEENGDLHVAATAGGNFAGVVVYNHDAGEWKFVDYGQSEIQVKSFQGWERQTRSVVLRFQAPPDPARVKLTDEEEMVEIGFDLTARNFLAAN